MSGETKRSESSWTVDTLKEYMKQRFIAQEKAVGVANEASEKRFDAVNEFRGQLNDQVRTFLPRAEYDARHETLENRVSEITNRLNRSEGKSSGLNAGWGYLAGIIGLTATIISVILAFNN